MYLYVGAQCQKSVSDSLQLELDCCKSISVSAGNPVKEQLVLTEP